jgi:hypothetical protein
MQILKSVSRKLQPQCTIETGQRVLSRITSRLMKKVSPTFSLEAVFRAADLDAQGMLRLSEFLRFILVNLKVGIIFSRLNDVDF